MTIAEVLLISTAITTALAQVFKKAFVPVGSKFNDAFEVFAVTLGIAVFYVFARANAVDVTNIWNAVANGLMVGLASIGAYQTGGITPVVNKLLK
jgi:hypothetical protein